MAEGLAAVTARIHEIRNLMGTLAPPPVQAPPSGASLFARVLAEASTPAGYRDRSVPPAEATPQRLDRPVGLGAAPFAAPAADAHSLRAFGNGRIPAEALTPIGRGSHRLSAPAAAAFRDLEAAASRDGISFRVTDSYRSYDEQVDLARRKGLYSQGGLAALPGTSDHGLGLSVDLGLDGPAQEWMRANAGRFGFVEDVPREPWHWTFQRPRA